MNETDQLGAWLDQNEAKQGTPEFEQNRERFRVLRRSEDQQQQDASLNTLQDRAQEAFANPGGVGSTAARVARMAITGIPDAIVQAGNALVRSGLPLGFGVQPGSTQEQPTPGELWDRSSGLPAAPPGDARAIAEGAGAAIIGGGLGPIRSAIQASPSLMRAAGNALGTASRVAITPTIGGHYGAKGGEYLANRYGFDPKTGALIGGVFGGMGASAVPNIVDQMRHASIASQAGPQARQVVADTQALDANNRLANAPAGTYGPPAPTPPGQLPMTAGQLGNERMIIREQGYGAAPGSREFIAARRQEPIDLINQSLDRITAQRGATDIVPDKASIGQGVRDITGETATGLQQRSSYEQQAIRDQMGPDASVPARPLFEQGYDLMPPHSMPGRRAIGDRLMNEVAPLAIPDPVTGEARIPIDPYIRMRTELGRDIDSASGNGVARAAPDLYGPATELYRNEAVARGVPAEQFDATMARNRDVMRPADPRVPGDRGGAVPQNMAIANKDAGGAFSWLAGGGANPERLQFLSSSEHPQVPGVMGDFLRYIQQKTVGTPSSQGPAQFNRAVSAPAMAPEALQEIAGPHAGEVQAAGRLAQSTVYPTNQMRLGRSISQGGDSVSKAITSSEIGSALGQILEMAAPSGIVPQGSLPAAGRVIGAVAQNPINRIMAGRFESPFAINALAGGPAPPPMTIPELAASLTAVSSQLPRR